MGHGIHIDIEVVSHHHEQFENSIHVFLAEALSNHHHHHHHHHPLLLVLRYPKLYTDP